MTHPPCAGNRGRRLALIWRFRWKEQGISPRSFFCRGLMAPRWAVGVPRTHPRLRCVEVFHLGYFVIRFEAFIRFSKQSGRLVAARFQSCHAAEREWVTASSSPGSRSANSPNAAIQREIGPPVVSASSRTSVQSNESRPAAVAGSRLRAVALAVVIAASSCRQGYHDYHGRQRPRRRFSRSACSRMLLTLDIAATDTAVWYFSPEDRLDRRRPWSSARP